VSAGAAARGDGYRIVRVTALHGPTDQKAERSKAARIHLRWREAVARFVVVGLERDE
jgi:hypothetical protein